MPNYARRHGLLALIAAACVAAPVQAADIHVISAAPMSGVLEELGAQFEREAGHRVVRKFVSGPLVKREVEAGGPYDVAISVTPVIDDLAKAGRIDASSRVGVAYSGVGVGVRAGAPKPDIGSVEAFKRALLAASSVTYDKDGAAGKYFVELLQRLGIAEPMHPKLRPRSLDNLYDAVPSGEVEMIVTTLSAVRKPGVDVVGPIPSEIQFYNRFSAGVVPGAAQPVAAASFVKFLVSPQAAAIIKSRDMEPGIP